jgi:hypothetical protein
MLQGYAIDVRLPNTEKLNGKLHIIEFEQNNQCARFLSVWVLCIEATDCLFFLLLSAQTVINLVFMNHSWKELNCSENCWNRALLSTVWFFNENSKCLRRNSPTRSTQYCIMLLTFSVDVYLVLPWRTPCRL